MKTLSVGKFASFLSVATLVLLAALMWSAGQSIAAAPVGSDAKTVEDVFVQDIEDDRGLRMKLIMHRPGHALIPAVKPERSCAGMSQVGRSDGARTWQATSDSATSTIQL